MIAKPLGEEDVRPAPGMQKPEWTDTGRMSLWINEVLDAELQAAVADATGDANLEEILATGEPISVLLEALESGVASETQQWRAAQLLRQAMAVPKPGPKPRPKIERDATLAIAARDARRIMDLWREHYGRTDQPLAIDIACERWEADEYARAELSERVQDTLRRPKGRNFGV